MSWSDTRGMILEQMEKLTILDELTADGAATIGTGATSADLVTDLDGVIEVVECVTNASKRGTGASSVFHLLKLAAQTVLMCAGANRGQRVPVVLDEIVVLFRYVLKDIIEVVIPSPSGNGLYGSFVFVVLEKLLQTVGMAEQQILRGWISQIVNSGDVKKMEENVGELLHQVITIQNAAENIGLCEQLKHRNEELCVPMNN